MLAQARAMGARVVAAASTSDKVEFAQACAELDIPHPATQVLDFAGSDGADWTAPAVEQPFPVVAKPATTSQARPSSAKPCHCAAQSQPSPPMPMAPTADTTMPSPSSLEEG